MRFLVTGGAGLVGSAVTKRLLRNSHDVLVVDDLSASPASNVPAECQFVRMSILDGDFSALVTSYSPQYVVHLAAWFANQNSIDFPESDLSVNGLGVLRVLEASEAAGVQRLVYSSSSCVYGGRRGLLTEEAAPGHLETPYAATKWLGEQYVRMWAERSGVEYVNLRLFNVYGPGDLPGQYRSVIPNFVFAALRDLPLVVMGTGEETRSFTFVDDVAERIMQSLLVSDAANQTLNCGTSEQTTILHLAERILRITGSSSVIHRGAKRPWDKTEERKPDLTRIERVLGAQQVTDLSEGLAQTIAWAKASE